MNTRLTRARLLVGGLLAAGLLVGAQPAAKADCLHLELYVSHTNAEPTWVYGKDNPCVTETPWKTTFTRWATVTRHGLPDGTPNGFHVYTRIPAP